jgi:hypothetical protein
MNHFRPLTFLPASKPRASAGTVSAVRIDCESVLKVAVYYRTNLTMRQLGSLFGVSSSTVRRVIQRLGPLLALEPVPRTADAADWLWIVDGGRAAPSCRNTAVDTVRCTTTSNRAGSTPTGCGRRWPSCRCPASRTGA